MLFLWLSINWQDSNISVGPTKNLFKCLPYYSTEITFLFLKWSRLLCVQFSKLLLTLCSNRMDYPSTSQQATSKILVFNSNLLKYYSGLHKRAISCHTEHTLSHNNSILVGFLNSQTFDQKFRKLLLSKIKTHVASSEFKMVRSVSS